MTWTGLRPGGFGAVNGGFGFVDGNDDGSENGWKNGEGFSDSKLVVGEVKGDLEARDPRM